MINSNELALLLSELPLKDSFIQSVTEHDFHSLTFSLFSKSAKAWMLYLEVGTPLMRVCSTGIMRKKAAKLQRFGQYLRANIIGCRIDEAIQVKGDRLFYLKCSHNNEVKYIVIRLYSGPGANIFILDKDFIIQEALMRRPQRGEEKGQQFTLPEPKEVDLERFPIRDHSGFDSFNECIDRSASAASKAERSEDLREKLLIKKEKELTSLNNFLKMAISREKETRDYETFKITADLLSSYSYSLRKGESSVQLYDFEGKEIVIALDRTLSPSENINAYYQKYKRGERIHNSTLSEIEEYKEKIQEREAYFNALLEEGSNERLERELKKEKENKKNESSVGLSLQSHGFDILVGRNARENDEILRHHTRGNDTWIHTRDYPGGYVIIKAKKDKSIPLEVLLDGANLAIHYSKAKNEGKADLYYTLVKYLRRAKDGKTGLVLPTQEKNLTVALDERRVKLLLSEVGDKF